MAFSGFPATGKIGAKTHSLAKEGRENEESQVSEVRMIEDFEENLGNLSVRFKIKFILQRLSQSFWRYFGLRKIEIVGAQRLSFSSISEIISNPEAKVKLEMKYKCISFPFSLVEESFGPLPHFSSQDKERLIGTRDESQSRNLKSSHHSIQDVQDTLCRVILNLQSFLVGPA